MRRFLATLSLMALLLMQACHPEPFLNVSPTSLSFNQDGGSQTVRVSANYAWTVSVSGTGLTVSPLSGEGEGIVTVTAAHHLPTRRTVGLRCGKAGSQIHDFGGIRDEDSGRRRNL